MREQEIKGDVKCMPNAGVWHDACISSTENTVEYYIMTGVTIMITIELLS